MSETSRNRVSWYVFKTSPAESPGTLHSTTCVYHAGPRPSPFSTLSGGTPFFFSPCKVCFLKVTWERKRGGGGRCKLNCAFAMGAGLQVRCVKPQEKTEGVRWFPPPLPPGVTEQSSPPPLLLLLLFPPSVPPPAADCAASLPSPLRGEEMRPCDSKRLQAGGIIEGQSGKKKKKQKKPTKSQQQ